MKFYPHNIPLNVIGNAVSSSIALSGSYIGNIGASASQRILSASIALNITGSPGANGTNADTITGPIGQTGLKGVTGPRGLNIWLLSSSWDNGGCTGGVNCYRIQMFKATTTECTEVSGSPVYTTYGEFLLEGVSPVYSDNICTTPLISQGRIGHTGNTVYGTDAFGTASFVRSCGPGV